MLYFKKEKKSRMKVKDFFTTQQNIWYTDIEKLNLYQNILYKKTKKRSLMRASFIYTKYAVYTTIFVFLFVGMYGMYIFNNNSIQDNKRFAIIKNSTNTVQADYIAQIIDAKGNFFVEHDGILTKTNNISNGDTIIIKEETQLVFEIDQGTQSKIIGPAKIVVQKTPNENYKLNLIYGDFIQLEWKKENTQTIEIAINDITIKQEDKTQPMNFKFIKEGNSQIFQNNGANLIVTKNNGEETSTTMKKEQVISIQNNDIKIFANIDNFTKAVQNKNISQTFSIHNETPQPKTSDEKELVTLLWLLTTPTTQEVNKEEVNKWVRLALGNEKKLLDTQQDEQINNNLYISIYTTEIYELEWAYKKWDIWMYNSILSKIERRIENVSKIFGFPYNKTTGEPKQKLEQFVQTTKQLKEHIQNNYITSPAYEKTLEYIEKSIKNIIQGEFASEKEQEIPIEKTTE